MRKDLIWRGLLVKNMSKGPNRLIFQIINPMPSTILQNSVNNNTSPPCFPSTRLATQHDQFTSLLPSPKIKDHVFPQKQSITVERRKSIQQPRKFNNQEMIFINYPLKSLMHRKCVRLL